ncbi:hypothetical protein EON65_22145 [archaeon]|nr:MAG: hypothetical protein EON65_22145 [archaeon]
MHKHYTDLWEHLKSLLSAITTLKKKDSPSISEQDQEAYIVLFRAWASYNVLLDAKSGLAAMVQPELPTSQYLQDMATWLFSKLPKLDKLSAEQMLVVHSLLSNAMLVLLDTVDLLSKPTFIVHNLIQYLEMFYIVFAEEKVGSVHDTLRRKTLIVCDRMAQQLGKMKAWSDAAQLKELTQLIDALLSTISGFVSEEDSAMYTMYQRCSRAVGRSEAKALERDESASKVTKISVANNENVLCN